MILTRRAALIGSLATLAGCDTIAGTEFGRSALFAGEGAHQALQRAVTDRSALAREYAPNERSPIFRANGTRNPGTPDYQAALSANFADWRIPIEGAVARPYVLPLNELRSMPARQQITRHDCVEGWSAIAKWTGPRLGPILDRASLLPGARYIVFHCADLMGGRPYYESIDLIDAYHPQTILAWALNDRVLGVANGAPVRLRVERQLGYKHAKYVTRIEAVASLDRVYGGRGGFWEDVADYEWYAGI